MTSSVRHSFNKQNLRLVTENVSAILHKTLNLGSISNHSASWLGCFSQHRYENSNDKVEV